MILQSLDALYSRLADDPAYGIAPPGFSPQKISLRIILNPDGSLFDIEDARTPDGKNKLQNTQMLVLGEAKPSGAGINPCFLWDNQTYLLGRQPEDKPDGFGLQRFEAFRKRHLDLEIVINAPEFSVVCRFLEQWNPERLDEFPRLNTVGTGFGIFKIRGEKKSVHEASIIQNWWIGRQTEGAAGEFGQCLLSGEGTPIARLHPKIKGVTGAQSAGASIVSFNENAYESYGKSQSYNAPVSEAAAFRYGTALNSLLGGPLSGKHRIRIGDTTTVFWTDKPSIVENCFADLISGGAFAPNEVQDESKRSQIQRLLEAIRSGGKFQELGDTEIPFHILGLAPNVARISIRFYHRSTVKDLLSKLHDHQKCMEMVRQTEQNGHRFPDPEFPAIWQILRETARVADEVTPLLGGALTRSIIQGTAYPEGLYAAILRRIRADRTINYLRVATLKAVLTRNHHQTINTMLDLKNTETSYLLGRLFAALEKTQEDALGNLNSGIRDRFYSSASATPVSVFPRLLRTYQHHLAKLNPGSKINRDRQIQEILGSFSASGFPNQLSLKAQGIFAIGYYHQRKDFFTKKESNESQSA